jgi:hypothetical protein
VQLAEKFGPFDDDDHAASVRQNVQSILSRTKLPGGERQFVSDRPTKLGPPVWSLNQEA